jgi:hypothetical protein
MQDKIIQYAMLGFGALVLYHLLQSGSAMSKKTEQFVVDSVKNTLAQEAEDKQENVIVRPEFVKDGRLELEANDLLPQDKRDSDFASEHPLSSGLLQNKNFLEAGAIIGQLSEPLRNTNLSVRAEPVIELQTISPWNNSTKPQTHGRGMEIL